MFCKARPVPFAITEDLEEAYDAGIKKGIWEPTQFNDYGTPVVPVKKAVLPGQAKPKLRVCGDYSVTVNDQPLPLPEDLMRKLGGGYGFTKIDLADAYNQIKLGHQSQKKLALNTHRGVLLQKRLPFGIKSAPGYFQQVMDQLTNDLPGVAVYLDDILVSGKDAEDHLANLQRILQRLDEKGFRCRLEKCSFAQPFVEYLGHFLSKEGIAKGPKVNAVIAMPSPTDVSSLKAFLGSLQFYAKFLPSHLASAAEPLYRLTRKNTSWQWGEEQQKSFQQLKDWLSSDNVLVHFDPALPLGLACDASSVGIGAVLFHRYPDGSERPISNVSKTLTTSQRNYSQIQKEALSIVFGLKKFYQYLYGRRFCLVTDHRPLETMFGPNKPTPALAANRLARWALLLSQFDYIVEYRRTTDHGNADALSRLPIPRADVHFDREEDEEDQQMVCSINDIDEKISPANHGSLARESAKDLTISKVMRFTREGWPPSKSNEEFEMQRFRKVADSLSCINGCLVHGSRVVIPASLRAIVLDLLHLGHFGMQRMKQLARTSVYWPNIDDDIEGTCRRCTSCAEHQNKPSKPADHS
ncbi:MAG: RNase H-like domain-containing protein [Kangiellaceae bacterium]|nr:RNase H-like domain-containing protein [Kangiellaceae bacterium]